MIAGERLTANLTKYKIAEGSLLYFDAEWLLSSQSFTTLNSIEWHKVPAKQYKYEEAVRISLEQSKTFDRRIGFSMTGVSGILMGSQGGDFITSLADINALWTEVKA